MLGIGLGVSRAKSGSVSDPYGAEELTNGDFTAGSASWNQVLGTMVFASDTVTFDDGGSRLDHSITLTGGVTYRVEVVVTALTAGQVYFQSSGITPTIGTTIISTGTHVEELTLSENGKPSLRTSGGSTDITVDSISIKEVL